jgi:S-adenosylmethionine hydrolase
MDTSPIVLTTDFGAAEPYAGMMKGVILKINPAATVVDLTHQIQPQNIRQAAFVLGTSYRFFPTGSIHVVVVDPGVGTDHRALLVVMPTARFLAPDNGLLSYVFSDYLEEAPQ